MKNIFLLISVTVGSLSHASQSNSSRPSSPSSTSHTPPPVSPRASLSYIDISPAHSDSNYNSPASSRGSSSLSARSSLSSILWSDEDEVVASLDDTQNVGYDDQGYIVAPSTGPEPRPSHSFVIPQIFLNDVLLVEQDSNTDEDGYIKLLGSQTDSSVNMVDSGISELHSLTHDNPDLSHDSFVPVSPRSSLYSEPGASPRSSLQDIFEHNYVNKKVYDIVFNSRHGRNIKDILPSVGFFDKYGAPKNSYDYYRRTIAKMEYHIFDVDFQQAVKNVAHTFKFKHFLAQDFHLDEFGLQTCEAFKSIIIPEERSAKKRPSHKIQEAQELLKKIFEEYTKVLKHNHATGPKTINIEAHETLAEIQDAIYRLKKINPHLDVLEFEFTYIHSLPEVKIYVAHGKKVVTRKDPQALIVCTGYRAQLLYELFFSEGGLVARKLQLGHLKTATLLDFFNNKIMVGNLRDEFTRSLRQS